MSIYTSPLQFGYFLSLLLFFVFLFRSISQDRYSDRFLAILMIIFALELQDYTFGFSGINILWERFNGFPRGVALLLGPMMFLYLKAQVDINWRFRSNSLWHLLPWGLNFVVNFIIYLQGPQYVTQWQTSDASFYFGMVETLTRWCSFSYYFYFAIKLYQNYKAWLGQSFSETETRSLNWFRNFIYLMVFWVLFREIMNVLDFIFDLSFYNDWWWNLALVLVSIYVGFSGVAQAPSSNLSFEKTPNLIESDTEQDLKEELAAIEEKLDISMRQDRFYLQTQLNIRDLAHYMRVPSASLSATINQLKGMNFNDYINSLRIEAFLKEVEREENSNFTLLGLALDAGFNSKATFHRAFKKQKGMSPTEYLQLNQH